MIAGVLGAIGLASPAEGGDMYKPPKAVAGGLDPQPTITSIVQTEGTAVVKWSGFLAPFQVQESSSLTAPLWQSILTTSDKQATLPAGNGIGFLRVASPVDSTKLDPALYIGASACAGCHELQSSHGDIFAGWSETRHAGAFETLRAIGQHTNSICLPCHTVGYGIPGGFRSELDDWHLEGVQCENCHGPAGRHAANPEDPSVRPQITIAAEVCGGCHTDFHHPTYDEWLEAGHSTVTEPNMFNSGVGRMFLCGVCHSGAVRQAVVRDYDAGGDGTAVVPPTINDANTYGQVCATCHDPHQKFDKTLPGLDDVLAQPHQLRNPISSTNFMSYFTSTNATNFAAQYNPNIQICGQCHNERGANWTGTGRPPHHSPQYNILVGQAVDPRYDTNTLNGQVISFNRGPAGHGDPTVAIPFGNPLQCTACHNRAEEAENLTPATPNYTGHRFQVQLNACADCHGFLGDPAAEEIAEGGIEFIQAGTHHGIAEAVAALDNWGATKITDLYVPGSTNYVTFIGTNAPASVVPWEFGIIGQLNPGKKSPPTAGQNRINRYAPEILKARFLLYIVEHDASYGVHNPPYARYLLQTAKELADQAPVIPAN